MLCSKCGNLLPNNSSFCNKCGLKITNNDDVKIPIISKKVNKKLITFGFIGVFLVIIIISIILYFNHSSIEKLSDTLTTNDASSKKEVIIKSVSYYKDGIRYYNYGDYRQAYKSFQYVVKEDSKNYKDATKKMEECRKKYDEAIIKKASEYASNQFYIQAVHTIEDALEIDTNNIELINLRDLYVSKDKMVQEDIKAKADSLNQGVRIGMTKQEVLDSNWGEPKTINRTTTQYGTNEQWVYYGNKYLYFDNGILTAIQN
jgi:tetratricopeptide (TPR) repeat protein